MPKAKFGNNAEYPNGFVVIECPGCDQWHYISVIPMEPNRPVWGFNGNMESPTFTPSVSIKTGKYIPGYEHYDDGSICHFHVTDGRIKYEPDTTHELSGQTIDLPDLKANDY